MQSQTMGQWDSKYFWRSEFEMQATSPGCSAIDRNTFNVSVHDTILVGMAR